MLHHDGDNKYIWEISQWQKSFYFLKFVLKSCFLTFRHENRIPKNLPSLRMSVLSAPHVGAPFERPLNWNLDPAAYKSITPVKCLTHFYLTVPSFLLAFLIWTNWSRCHSPPILTLGLAFHYRLPNRTLVWDKLVMSKVKLYPGFCNSIHLSKRGGGKNC